MAAVTMRKTSGAKAGSVELDPSVFGIDPNVSVMHQVVTAQLAARRSGTQSTKTRSEVRGGGAKPWRQKGTGRARAGSSRSPIWRGGGVALGPKPRSYAQRTPKKMVQLALRSALSDRAADDKVIVVDEWTFPAPRTKDAVAALEALGIDGRVLLVLDAADVTTWKSFRNVPSVHIIDRGQLNAYDVLVSDWVIFSQATLPTPTAEAATKGVEAKPKKAKPAPKAKVDADKTPKPKPARKPAKDAAGASKADTSPSKPASDADDDPTEGDDMASDLPNRPKPEPGSRRAPVEATDRVKSGSEKGDPRFEAAKNKAGKEDALREKVAAKAAEQDAAKKATEEAPVAEAEDKPGDGFSFNSTSEGQ